MMHAYLLVELWSQHPLLHGLHVLQVELHHVFVASERGGRDGVLSLRILELEGILLADRKNFVLEVLVMLVPARIVFAFSNQEKEAGIVRKSAEATVRGKRALHALRHAGMSGSIL